MTNLPEPLSAKEAVATHLCLGAIVGLHAAYETSEASLRTSHHRSCSEHMCVWSELLWAKRD
jgi:hypothetical protein